MHSLRHAALRAASSHGMRVAVAVPRAALAADALTTRSLPSTAVVLSRSFVTTRWLAEHPGAFSNTEDGASSNVASDATTTSASAASAAESAPTPGQVEVGSEVRYAKGGDTPYGLFVRNLVFDANEEHIADAFQKYGQITKVWVARDARGLSRGYAFVYFTNADDMNKAAAGANGSFWHGRRIHAAPRLKTGRQNKTTEPVVPLSERTPTTSLYIGNIPYETTDAELNKLFRSLDNVKDVRIAVDRSTGWPRGFAHADFTTEEAAMEAALKLQKTTLLGRELRIDFSQNARNRADRSPLASQSTSEDGK